MHNFDIRSLNRHEFNLQSLKVEIVLLYTKYMYFRAGEVRWQKIFALPFSFGLKFSDCILNNNKNPENRLQMKTLLSFCVRRRRQGEWERRVPVRACK